jgi:hypothetical protein
MKNATMVCIKNRYDQIFGLLFNYDIIISSGNKIFYKNWNILAMY